MHFSVFIQIGIGNVFFGISAQNNAEWLSNCPDSIDFWLIHIPSENLRNYVDQRKYGGDTPRGLTHAWSDSL